ncbi:MAG TPA: hypothetical protein VN363_08330, partial [Anaerolineales bacterium]|nr:hypothetical protein [Anaerolineales bacterium]
MSFPSIALAATWNPRGETRRLELLLERLRWAYTGIYISLSPLPDDPASQTELLDRLAGDKLKCQVNPDWSWGRYTAVQMALSSGAPWIHYVDLDRLLRWVEGQPDEWAQTLSAIQGSDYLVIGRTKAAYATHPQALVQTEALSNTVISFLVGQQMDVSAGSKGFSRQAASYVIENTMPGHALGTDGEWTVLLHRAGFKLGYIEVNGLDWESADRYQNRAADPTRQRQAA